MVALIFISINLLLGALAHCVQRRGTRVETIKPAIVDLDADPELMRA